MRVLLVRDVRERMSCRFVPMQMAVLAHRQRLVRVHVVAVVMAVGVLVFHIVVLVFVRMAFCEMKQDAAGHQHRASKHPGAATAFPECKREECADERSERKHGAGARRTESALSQQVEAKTEPVAGRADCQQSERGPHPRCRFADNEPQQRRRDGADRTFEHHDLSRVAIGYDKVLSTPQAAVAAITASSPRV